MRWVWRALACSGIHLAFAAAVSAQVGTETSISGVVTDSSGAVVPGASIAAVQRETGLVRTAESDSRGSFEVWGLPIGPYEITVAANGFTTWKAERIVLTVGERRRLFPRLNISKVTQEVTVVGGAAESLQTDNSAVQTVVQMQQIRELPLRTRNPVALVGLVPGMRFLSSDSGAERNAYVQGLGARSNATGFQIDGANANSGMDEGAMGVSNVETIAEFSVQTSSFDASSGRSPIQVVMASRSGTNDIHGTVWEFFQDDALNARNAFATEEPAAFERHEVGASLGGPIVRDRLFFFGSGQARPLTDFRVYNDTVPTPAMFQGDFSHLGSPIVDPATGEPFPGNRIAANRISSASRYFEPNFLAANGDGGAFRGEASRSQDIYEYFGRLDYQLSAAQRLYGRWIYSKSVKDLPQYKPELVTSDDTAQHNVAINYSHTLSSSVLLTATAGYLRSDNRFEAPGIGDTNPSNEAGIQGLDTPGREAYIGPPAINVTGYTGVGLPFGVNGRLWSSVTNAEVSVTALRRLGQTSHSLSAGYEWNDRTTFGAHGSSSPRGSFTFNGQYTGNGFADYLLGLPSSTDRNYPLRKFGIEHSPYSGLFAQDNVHITPTLSAMFGVRYEYWHAKGLVPGNSSIFDPRTGKMVASENENGEADLSYQPVARFLGPATEGLWITASEAGMDPGLFEPTGHWAPRFGVTWRAHPSVVVRAGYGHYFNSFSGNRTGSTVNIPYWTLESQTFTNTQLERWETAWPEDPTFFIAPVVYSPIYDFGATRSEQFNASVQVALPLQSALTLAYVGARYEGQAAVLPQNEVPPGQYDDLAAARPYQGLSNIWMIAPAVDSSYDSLQAKWERRYANGFSAIVSYAWSKNIAEHQANGELASVVPFAPPGYDRGRSDDDRTHLVSVAAVYYLPIGRDKPFLSNIPRAVDALIGGWELSAVNTFQSGTPLTFWTPGASLGNGWGTRANLVGDPHVDEPTRERWFNTEAFTPAAQHTWGDSGIGVVDGPSYNSLDLALAKNFSLGANRSLQVRFEMFNALNRVNLGTPVTTLNDANFGRILSAGDPRTVQIGARFQF